MTELQIQTTAWQYIYVNYPQTRGLLFHVPNGGSRDKREAGQLKASGVVSGIPDLILIWEGCVYGIEVKTPEAYASHNKGCSDNQIKIHNAWERQNINVIVLCYARDIVSYIEKIIL